MNAHDQEFVSALTPVIDALEALGVPYYVTGSVVSSRHGRGRSTADVDVVADLKVEHAAPFETALLQVGYYVDRESIEDAIARRSMFNVVHNETMIKVDVYAVTTEFDRATLRRAQPITFLDAPDARRFVSATAEDIILHKLRWYRMTGETSERQWGDVVGVVEVLHARLDLEYLRNQAGALGLSELVERLLVVAAT